MSQNMYQFILGSLLSYFFVAIILPILRQKLLDTPNNRSSHYLPTPRGGGIVFVIVGSLLTYIFSSGTMRWIPILCLPLSIIGIIDDYKDVSAFWRYFVQFLTVLVLLYVAKIEIPIWSIPFLILILTGIINFVNFMDGLDGIVAGSAVLLMAAGSNWSLSGSIFGFLIWNWSPAKVFMGDVGSTFIGAVFAGLIIQQPTTENAFSFLLLGFPLFGDAAVCIIRRLHCGKNIFSPHRQHLYQRLNQAGWNHSQVALVYILAVFILILGRAIGGLSLLIALVMLELLLAFVLDLTVATKFEKC